MRLSTGGGYWATGRAADHDHEHAYLPHVDYAKLDEQSCVEGRLLKYTYDGYTTLTLYSMHSRSSRRRKSKSGQTCWMSFPRLDTRKDIDAAAVTEWVQQRIGLHYDAAGYYMVSWYGKDGNYRNESTALLKMRDSVGISGISCSLPFSIEHKEGLI